MDTAAPAAWPGATVDAVAPAKINLALHVTGRRADGYHLLDSLVVFASEGDRLTFTPAERDDLLVTGPFAAGLSTDERNIARRALVLAREVANAAEAAHPFFVVNLEKRLPLASGLGGGSADAAAVLRFAASSLPHLAADLRAKSVRLGADLPMCFDGVPARVSGVGEIVQPVRQMPKLHLVLANPGSEMSTPAVFAAIRHRDNPPMPDLPADGFGSLHALLAYLKLCRNDLAEAARGSAPDIGQVEEALESVGALLVRMSGSGATVFGIFSGPDAAKVAAVSLQARHPGWWVRATETGASHDTEPKA